MQKTRKPAKKFGFKTGENIVYPAHGVGEIMGVEREEIAGAHLELYVIKFEKDKMILRVPVQKAEQVGMRRLSCTDTLEKAFSTLQGRARVKRVMWSRRAQEYEAKINSGSIVSVAEVVRDLYRTEDQPEPSYSERQLFEAAFERFTGELSAAHSISETEAGEKLRDYLKKAPRRTRKSLKKDKEDEQVVAA